MLAGHVESLPDQLANCAMLYMVKVTYCQLSRPIVPYCEEEEGNDSVYGYRVTHRQKSCPVVPHCIW